MRIISAHYSWDRTNSFVKNPIIHIDNEHRITSHISLGESYIENAHTEFFGGLLIPSFLGVTKDQGLLNMLYSSGSLYVTSSNIDAITGSVGEKPKMLTSGREVVENINPWAKLVDEVKSGSENSIEILLNKYLANYWIEYKQEFPAGSFKKGYKPGVLLINGIDWEGMKFDENLSLRIIDFPY